jgi:glycine/D-amino acid oxidase-like deaminating enzyme
MNAQVVVVGAGIIGTALAARVAEAGARVSLVDAGPPGGGTTATSLAWLNANRKTPRDYFALNEAAMRDWAAWASAFGDPDWYVPTGHLAAAVGDDERAELVARVERLRDWGYGADLVSAGEAVGIEPHLRLPDRATVAYFPAEGFVHGRQAALAFAARARDLGATLVTGRVTGFSVADGRVTGVRLDSGPPLTGDAVVCCTGWRSNDLLESLRASVALVPGDAPGSPAPCLVADTGAVPGCPNRVVSVGDLSARPLLGGGMRLLVEESARGPLGAWTAALPALTRSRVHAVHRCVRPLPVDGYPIVGWYASVPGLYVIVTHSGITLAPRLAALATGEILHDHAADALAPYRPGRQMAESSRTTSYSSTTSHRPRC